MTAFFVANVTVKDPEKFQQYAQKTGETFAAYGGEPVLRGKTAEVLAGSADHQAVGIVKFPDQDSLLAWYNSAAYQALLPLRNEGAEVTIVTYDIPA